jgi:hypothetical protein
MREEKVDVRAKPARALIYADHACEKTFTAESAGQWHAFPNFFFLAIDLL